MPSTHTLAFCLAGLVSVVAAGGCKSVPAGSPIVPPDVPVELNKVTHPEYLIEAPDILQITAIQAVPRQPYKIQPFDTLSVVVLGTLKDNPIAGLYVVDPDGVLNFGPTYKTVKVSDMTAEEAQKAIEAHLGSKEVGLTKPTAAVTISQTRGVQQIAGEHLVRADGTVYLGTFGSVSPVTRTLPKVPR